MCEVRGGTKETTERETSQRKKLLGTGPCGESRSSLTAKRRNGVWEEGTAPAKGQRQKSRPPDAGGPAASCEHWLLAAGVRHALPRYSHTVLRGTGSREGVCWTEGRPSQTPRAPISHAPALTGLRRLAVVKPGHDIRGFCCRSRDAWPDGIRKEKVGE